MMTEDLMFCYQCEQTAHCTGCTTVGVCGKSSETAALQDLMMYQAKGISQYANAARRLGVSDTEINRKTLEALFMTLTNVNFDAHEHYQVAKDLEALLEKARQTYLKACADNGVSPTHFSGPANFKLMPTEREVLIQAESLSIPKRLKGINPDLVSLEELLTYGVKGLAAYAHHAVRLGYEDEGIYAFVHKSMSAIAEPTSTMDELLELVLEAGRVNYDVMEILDRAHTESFDHPVPTAVNLSPVQGKAILVSGHDMKALYELLKQTEGKGVNVYTHGEMLPAHGYPKLKAFKHLVGHYGGAWQNQVGEFDKFPGSILMTTNCLKPPAESYKQRLFTMDVVGWHDVKKVDDANFSALIDAALASPGFTQSEPEKTITVGFARNAVLSVAPQVIDAVKAGQIKHFFLVGGCDGAEWDRNYFTQFADAAPENTVILTLGCGKFRFNTHEFGDIGGIPRLLDIGQCNDAYSAIQIASALAEAFGVGINELPLSLIISWFEQKAVAVLLTLLALGVKNIRLGPNLPAFITPNVLNVLVENYQLKPIGTAQQDLANILELQAA